MAHEVSGQMNMYTAAVEGNLQRIKELLEEGVCVNSKLPEYGLSALILAARTGQTDGLNRLIKAGADVNYRDDYMETALMSAVDFGHDDCVNILLENGAEIEVIGRSEYFLFSSLTPLMLAADRGSMRCLSLLLEKGACVNQMNVKGLTALIVKFQMKMSWKHF